MADAKRMCMLLAITAVCGISMLLASSCVPSPEPCDPSAGDSEKTTLQDIAWDPDTDGTESVSICGDTFLVVTSDYNGYCLLVREHLLDEARIYNKPGESASYYPGSDIDAYLEGEYLESLPDSIRGVIVPTDIYVTAASSLYIGGDATETVTRSVFLLSATELNATGSRTNLTEGEPLRYFASADRRIATYEDGSAGSWWLRTPNTSSGSIVCGVDTGGVVGIGGIYNPNEESGYRNGVRPAFCLPGDIKVKEVGPDIYELTESK